DSAVRTIDLSGNGIPLLAQCCLRVTRLSRVTIGQDLRNSRPRARPSRHRMVFALQHQKSTHGRKGDAAIGAAIPYRSELLLQDDAAKFECKEYVPARAMIGAANQRQLALSGGDARLRHTDRIDPCGLLAHECARSADNAVDQRNVAG